MSNYPPSKALLHSWLTIKLLAELEPSFTESALRYYVFNAAPRQTSKGSIPGNGLSPHIRRIGSKVLINHGGFLSWIDGGSDRVDSVADPANQGLSSPPGNCASANPMVIKGDEAESRFAALKAEPFTPKTQKDDPKSYSKQRSRRRI